MILRIQRVLARGKADVGVPGSSLNLRGLIIYMMMMILMLLMLLILPWNPVLLLS